MTKKECTKCRKPVLLMDYYKCAANPSGLQSSCKLCSDKANYEYLGTKEGLLAKIYATQRNSSKQRSHPMPAYTRDELGEWLFAQPNFDELFDNWHKSGRDQMLVPSVDRDKDDLPYFFGNIVLMTWDENKNKSHEDRRNGKLACGITRKAVIGKHKKTGRVLSFISAHQAKRGLGISQGNISACCIGKRMSAGGYTWKFK